MQGNSSISNFKYCLRFIIFIAIVAMVFLHIGKKYEAAADKNVINAFTQKRFDDFYALPPQSLDMVFVGSSHSYCTFNPENFDSDMGIQSFQMGTPLQHPDTTYYSLKEIFNTQTPKTVVMELYWDVLDDDFEMKQANSFFEVLKDDTLKDDTLKKDYIKNVFPLSEKVKYSLLPIRFQQDCFAYEANNMEKDIEERFSVEKEKTESQVGEEYYASKGYVYCNMLMLSGEYDETNQFKGLDGANWQPNKEKLYYLDKIAELCNEKGSELILVTAPIANVSMKYIENYDMIHEQLAAIAEKLSARYIDYNIVNRDLGLLENENFRDDAHLNDSGVIIVDNHFKEWLLKAKD